MSDQKNYKISPELAEQIIDFLENPFEGLREAKELLQNNDIFTADEVNRIVAIIGKFPAFSVYKILGQLSTKVEEIEP
jgi:hypothetical protein